MADKFTQWFRQQFHRLPDQARLNYLRAKRRDVEARLGELDAEIYMLSLLDREWTAALYGWQAGKVVRSRREGRR